MLDMMKFISRTYSTNHITHSLQILHII